MEHDNDAYELSAEGVPLWVDFDEAYEECGSRVLEAVVARRRIDRSLPNNGVVEKKQLPLAAAAAAVHRLPTKPKAGGGGEDDVDDDGDGDGDDDDEDGAAAGAAAAARLDPFKERYSFDYQCKFKGRSYRHLEWRAAEELETMSLKGKQLFWRYLKRLELLQEAGEDEADEAADAVWDVERLLLRRTYEVELPDESFLPPEDTAPAAAGTAPGTGAGTGAAAVASSTVVMAAAAAADGGPAAAVSSTDGLAVSAGAEVEDGGEASTAEGDACDTIAMELASATGVPKFAVGEAVEVARGAKDVERFGTTSDLMACMEPTHLPIF